MDDLPTPKHRLLTLLNSLKEASKVLHTTTNPFSFHSRTDSRAAIDTLLDLEAKAHATLSSVDPTLRNLSRTLIDKLHKHHDYSPRSLLHHHVTTYKISHLARAIESQILSYIDRLNIRDLVHTLQQQQQQVKVLVEFRQRLSQGFDLEFQDLILRAKVFTLL